MSFFKSLKQAFGLGESEYDDEELEGIDARVTPLRERRDCASQSDECASESVSENNTETADGEQASQMAVVETVSTETLPRDIFDSVVKVFNESLPEFLKQTVDETAQKEYLYNALEASTRDFLNNAGNSAQRRCDEHWLQERRQILQEMEALKQRANKEEEDRSEAKKQQLSAERQKRALSERVHDLEKQLATLQAENEQYVLENKSLVNKLRLSQVLGGDNRGDNDEITEKILQLNGELESLRTKYEASKTEIDNLNAVVAEKDDAIDELSKNTSEKDEELKAALAESDTLREQLRLSKEALEQSRAKDDLGNAMLTDLNRKTAEAVEAANEHKKRVESLLAENEALKHTIEENSSATSKALNELEKLNEEYSSLKESFMSLNAEHGTLQAEYQITLEKLNESMESLEVVEEMSRQLDVLEKARQNNESFLRKQKDDLMHKAELLRQAGLEKKEFEETIRYKDEAIRRLEDLSDSLRKTIENNLYEHAQSESALRSEIERLKAYRGAQKAAEEPRPEAMIEKNEAFETSDTAFEITPPDSRKSSETPVRKRKSKKQNVKISAIDDTLDDTDWLLATPPAGKNDARQDESQEFGYREPTRRQTPENPAQMSLW